jgi:hypothetical protein
MAVERDCLHLTSNTQPDEVESVRRMVLARVPTDIAIAQINKESQVMR